jgi:hypothetical protein
MSSCFSRCLRVPIAMRAFYKSCLWILQTLLLKHPDLHPGLLGSSLSVCGIKEHCSIAVMVSEASGAFGLFSISILVVCSGSYWSSAVPYTDKYSEARVTSLERCPTESVNSIAGSDEVLYRPIGKAYRGDLVAFGAGNIRYIVFGGD